MINFVNNKAENVKIAYIGGGSRGWAWGLMSDLAVNDDMSGSVYLYDIDFYAAQCNEIIGNKLITEADGVVSHWDYKAVETIEEALLGADFVVISILPATFDEMESDVHTPDKYGIYQTVGDTTGPGGILRAMRTVPMYEHFAEKIKECCPNAWVISYTNPMTMCIRTLYRVFPEIKAFGCCHEVFGTQELLANMVKEFLGVENVSRNEIKVNPVSVNHFTWLTKATYKNVDLFPIYKQFCDKYSEIGYTGDGRLNNPGYMKSNGKNVERVKMDLFKRFGWIAAAGDSHLAEFCEGKWYLESPEKIAEMGFMRKMVYRRKESYKEILEKRARLVNGEEPVKINRTGEEGVKQMRALLGLHEFVTNVNIPNVGQIPNLPIGAVVETNARFCSNSVTLVFAGAVPKEIYPMVSRIAGQHEALSQAIADRNVERIFNVFVNDPLVTCSMSDAKKLFIEMCDNTMLYLTMYDFSNMR